MRMVKRLLLGAAAGFVAVAGAQAADLPVKAKPVQYVKICTLYGDGFYYIPGTNTCLKLGGYVRVQAETNMGSGAVATGDGGTMGAQARFARDVTNDVNYRVRTVISLDVRDQTEYGVLRSFFRIGIQQTTPTDGQGGNVYWDQSLHSVRGVHGRQDVVVVRPLQHYHLFLSRPARHGRHHRFQRRSDLGLHRRIRQWFLRVAVAGRPGRACPRAGGGCHGSGLLRGERGHRRRYRFLAADGRQQRLPDARHRRQPEGRPGLGLRRRQRCTARGRRRLLRRAQQRQQRPSRRQARLGGLGRRQAQPLRAAISSASTSATPRARSATARARARRSSTMPRPASPPAGLPTASSPPAPRSN